jgi:hypothetical protein
MEYVANKDDYNIIMELSVRANSEYFELVKDLSPADKAECLLTMLRCMRKISLRNTHMIGIGLN